MNSDALWAQLAAGNSDDLWQSATLSPDEQQQYEAKAQRAEAIAKRIEQNPYAVLDDPLALPGDRFTAALRAMEGREKNGTLDPLYYPKKFPIVGQALAAREALDAKTAIELVQNGSATAQEYYDAARYVKMLEAQGQWDMAQRIANGILDIGGFVGDMLATGGIATGVSEAAARGLGAHTAKTVVGRQAARLGGGAIGTVTQAGLMPQRTARSAIERSMDQIAPNAEGGIDVVKEGKSAPQAVAEGFGDTLTEVATERAGALIARFLPNKGLATGQAGRMFGAAPDGALARAGVQSLPIEMAEERLGDVIRGVTGLEENFGATGQALTGNFQPLLEEAAVLAVPGGVSLASQAARAPAQQQLLDVLTSRRKDLHANRTQQQEAFAAALQDPQAAQAWAQTHPEQARQVASAENFSGHMARRVGLARIGTPEARAAFQQNVRAEVARQQAEQQRKDARWTRNPREARADRFSPSERLLQHVSTLTDLDSLRRDPTPPDTSAYNPPSPRSPSRASLADTADLPGELRDSFDVGAYNPEVLQPSASRSVTDTQPTEVLDAVSDTTSVVRDKTTPAPTEQSPPALARLEGPQLEAARGRIASVFPGAKLHPLPEAQTHQGGYRVEFARGHHVDVVFVPEITPDSEGVRRSFLGQHGREPTPEEMAALAPSGAFLRVRDGGQMSRLGAIALVTGQADDSTLKHEALHLARRAGLFTDREWQALTKKYAPDASGDVAEERIAYSTEAWSEPTVGERVIAFLRKLLESLGLMDARSVEVLMQTPNFWARQPQAQPSQAEAAFQMRANRPPLTDPRLGQVRPLKDFADRLYREIGPEFAELYLPTSNTMNEGPFSEVWLAASEELALGQRDNKGIMLEFSPGELQGHLNTRMPGWELVYHNQAEGELVGTHNRQGEFQKNLQAITIRPDTKMDRITRSRLRHALDAMESQGWTKTETPAGVRYERPQQYQLRPRPTGPNPNALTNPRRPSLTQSPEATRIAITTPMPRGVKKTLSWLQKYMTSRGDLPQEAFERAVAKDATIAYEEQAIRNNANDLRDALKASTGSTTLTPAGQQQIDAALKGDQQALAALPPPVQTAITKMRDHIDTLSRRLLASGLPGEALELSINENMGVYTTRSYRVFDDPDWKGNVPANVRQAAFTHLQSVYPNETDQQINNRIDDMLTREQAPQALVKGSRLGSKDLGITRARKDIDPAIRALLGEYTDPQVNYARSATKIAHLVANHEFLKDVKQAGLGKFFFERDDAQRPEGYNVEFAAEGSKALEPLNGLMTTPEIKQAFQDVYAKDTPGWFMQQFLRANYAVKYGKTVGSLMTHVRNLTGNTMFAVQNGHWNLPKMGAALAGVSSELQQNMPTAVRSIWKTNAAWRDAFARYTKLGLVGDGITGSELQAALNDSLDMMPAAVKESAAAKAIEMGKQGLKALTTAYQLEDAVWKIYAFENERARYQAAYEKAGQPKTDAELDALAAKIVRDTYPTYSMVPRAVRGLRKAPLIGAFVSFPAEVIRTTFHSTMLARQELNDPALRSIGAQRLAGNALALTIPYALTLGVRMALGIGDDEDRDLREFLPEWQKDADILWLSKPQDGKAEYVDLSYSMPNSAMREPFHAMLRGEDAYDALKKGSWTALEPFIGEDILAGKLLDIARNTTKNKREVYPEFGSDAAKAKAIGAHLYDAFEPGTVTSLKRIKKGVEGHVEPWGREYDPADEAIAMATGVRFQDVDAEQSLFFHARKFAQSKQKTTGMLSGTLGSKGSVTEEQVGKAYQDSEEARQQQFERLHRAAKAALNLGVPRDKVMSVLSSAGISATTKKDGTLSEAERVILGDYRPYKISRDLYERVKELPQGAERLATYEKASGDAETMSEFVTRDIVKATDAIVRPRPLKRADVEKWQSERQSALQWLRDQGVSRQQVLAAYGPELAKIKTPSYRSEKRRRLAQVLGGL